MKPQRTAYSPPAPVVTKKRCAIYTRKSSDEGLDQEYNSLEAQRDAGLAFIASQRHEGWLALDDGYDDGGFSGGNMEPAIRRRRSGPRRRPPLRSRSRTPPSTPRTTTTGSPPASR